MTRQRNELTPSQVREMIRQLSHQPDSGSKSKQIVVNVIRDASGNKYYVGGHQSSVEVDDQGTPITLQKNEARRLDCGHVVGSAAEYGAICSQGHEICKRHEIRYCNRCSAVVCEFCDYRESDDELICPRHSFLIFMGELFGRF